jgi:hypothetical protein
MQAADDGTLYFAEGLINQNNNAEVLAQTDGTIQIGGSAIGGTAQFYFANDAHLAFNGGASTMNVDFGDTGSKDELTLGITVGRAGYSGLISNFHTSDSIDVKDVGFVAGEDYVTQSNGISTLTLIDGASTSEIHFKGSYTLSDFSIGTDGGTGTLIVGIGHSHLV